ncbi:hypothetical protein [Nocardioides sp. SYSU DS0651]|uniref:hypothetical protein n=1 Tax=Nocardioides sp. SYSU DS0651 TaxID=3415955 RepID=UPI003F4C7912
MSDRTNPLRRVRLAYRTKVLLAAGVVASMVPVAGGPAGAVPAEGAPARAAAAYGGYTATAWATPIRVEVYEPSLPIPATPQVEFEMGYSKVKADSGSSTGRASYFWPGDPVGEGLRTFAEQLGLPADNPLTGNGYPVQVNSQYPGEPPSQRDEPFPGMVMRTTSGDKTAVAENGFSPDGVVLGPEASEPPKGGDPSGNPLAGLQDQLGNLLGGGLAGTSTKKTAMVPGAPSVPGLPPELGLLVDMDGYVSVSRMDATKDPIATASRASLGEIRLLGGLLTLGGLETVARATTDGAKGAASGKAAWGRMAIAGQEFEMGPDGIKAAGKTTPIPFLKDAPAAALEQLGITIEVPKPTRKVEGDLATSVHEGLRVTLDTKVLAPVLKAIPSSALGELIPAEAGPLKGIVSGLSGLAPKIVLTLGVASATVDTVPPIEVGAPPAPGVTDAEAPPPASGGNAGGGGSAGAPPAAGDSAPTAPAGAADAKSGEVDALVDAAPASAGLPALFSIPGMLLIAAFAAAAVAGSWFRRIGAAALGGGGACPHGLDSGLPDLRKA